MSEDSAVLLTEASNHVEVQHEAWWSVELIDLARLYGPVLSAYFSAQWLGYCIAPIQ